MNKIIEEYKNQNKIVIEERGKLVIQIQELQELNMVLANKLK
jgi:hypothetical protein